MSKLYTNYRDLIPIIRKEVFILELSFGRFWVTQYRTALVVPRGTIVAATVHNTIGDCTSLSGCSCSDFEQPPSVGDAFAVNFKFFVSVWRRTSSFVHCAQDSYRPYWYLCDRNSFQIYAFRPCSPTRNASPVKLVNHYYILPFVAKKLPATEKVMTMNWALGASQK